MEGRGEGMKIIHSIRSKKKKGNNFREFFIIRKHAFNLINVKI